MSLGPPMTCNVKGDKLPVKQHHSSEPMPVEEARKLGCLPLIVVGVLALLVIVRMQG